jgi:hypothetical protein
MVFHLPLCYKLKARYLRVAMLEPTYDNIAINVDSLTQHLPFVLYSRQPITYIKFYFNYKQKKDLRKNAWKI